ncbi:nucleotidyltransferase domain-containing protein [Alkalinema pantanalense CENA528]|uniref:nucleotidyltransferase domain-containing protein n=1 Tax=Alkalinema pantanalense TaxID=1620705 RepID=UPI003D6DC709
MQHPKLPEILARLRQYLEALYGDRLAQVILYGSQARSEATPESDIDILVALKGTVDFALEVQRTNDFIADLCLESGTLVSVTLASLEQVESAQAPFFRNLRREGILV